MKVCFEKAQDWCAEYVRGIPEMHAHAREGFIEGLARLARRTRN